jgi:hypothetical protein
MRTKMTREFYFRWCIDSDIQVYIKPESYYYRIAIRKGGITSNGKDFHYDGYIDRTSSEVLGTVKYKTVADAEDKLLTVYKYLYDEDAKRLSGGPV